MNNKKKVQIKMFTYKVLLFVTFYTLALLSESESCFSRQSKIDCSYISFFGRLTQPTVTPEDVTFLLQSPSGKSYQELLPSNASDLLNSSYQTKIIIHGWESHPHEPWIYQMGSTYHRKSNCNVMVIDWTLHSSKNYFHASRAAQYVGYIIGDFILQSNLSLKNIHIIGHSLGAQVAGFVGKKVEELTGHQIDRISGLDAAGPLFEIPFLKSANCRLSKTDAGFVDLIHTLMGLRGVISALGHVDFYVNGGFLQPKCIKELPRFNKFVSCGHQIAHYYFTKTILNPEKYEAVACDSLRNFARGECDENRKAFMGEGVGRVFSGTFYVEIDENEFNKNNNNSIIFIF